MGKRRVLAVSILAASLLGAGCSSSGSPQSGATSGGSQTSGVGAQTGPASPATGGTPGTPIKVGMICSCTGPFGTNISAAGKVTDAWVKSINSSGGIAGHPIELMNYDDAGNPGTSVTDAQKLVSAKVDVILDLTPLDAVWAKAVSDAKIPVVGGELNSDAFAADPDFYSSGQTADSLPESIAVTAKQAGARNIGELYCAEAPSCQETIPRLKSDAKNLGVPVIYTASIAATAPNYTAQCLAAKQAGVTGLYVSHSASVVARVASDCDRQGYDPIILEAGTGYSMQLATAPGTKDHLWIVFPILPFFAHSPAVTKMNDALDKYYPGLRTNVDVWSTFASQAWTGALLIEAAVKSAAPSASAELSADVVTNGLNSLHNETLDGWSPGLTFSAGRPHVVHCWYTARVQNGMPSLANGGKPSCQQSS